MFTVLFWKKAWVWLKHHWYIPALLFYTLIMWLVFRRRNDNLVKLFDVTKESYEKQIQALNEAHQLEIQKREKLLSSYQEALKTIEKEYNIKLKDLDRKKRVEVENLSKDFEKDPSVLVDEMKELFGV